MMERSPFWTSRRQQLSGGQGFPDLKAARSRVRKWVFHIPCLPGTSWPRPRPLVRDIRDPPDFPTVRGVSSFWEESESFRHRTYTKERTSGKRGEGIAGGSLSVSFPRGCGKGTRFEPTPSPSRCQGAENVKTRVTGHPRGSDGHL